VAGLSPGWSPAAGDLSRRAAAGLVDYFFLCGQNQITRVIDQSGVGVGVRVGHFR
jgi:hypothetical protein